MLTLFFNWLSSVTDKILSARFIITVMFGVTYSHIVWHVVHSYLTAMKDKPELLEAFATGVFTGFSGLAVLVVKSYFDRQDRPEATKLVVDESRPIVAQINPKPEESNKGAS